MIFGVDDRRVAASGSFALYPTIVQVVAYFSDGYVSQGSGVVVGYNDVLSAAHVIYDEDRGGYAKRVEVIAALNSEYKPFGVADSSALRVSLPWMQTQSYAGDYALITVAEPIGYYTGFAGVSAYSDSVIGQDMVSYGYPGDLDNGLKMYKTAGSVDYVDENALQFSDDLDAYAGQSGSGVFIENGEEVLGVVSYEGFNGYERVNSVLGFTDDIAYIINGWIASNDGSIKYKTADTALKPIINGLNLMFFSFLGHTGDKESLDFLASAYLSGASVEDISAMFYNSSQYQNSAYSKYDNEHFVKYIFENVLDMSYGAADVEYWSFVLDSNGMSRADIMQLVAFLPSFVDKHALDIYDFWHDEYDSLALEAKGSYEKDILSAAKDEDTTMYGFGGDDLLLGKGGDDYLWGGSGDDTLSGGDGSDFFAWGENDGYDIVEDFSIGQDYIRLRGDFEWGFAAFDGNLLLESKNDHGGLILVGISPTLYAQVKIIEGTLV